MAPPLPINVLTSAASCKMSGRMRELLANDDKVSSTIEFLATIPGRWHRLNIQEIAKTAAEDGATVQRNVRHRRRKSMPYIGNSAQLNRARAITTVQPSTAADGTVTRCYRSPPGRR